MSKTADRMIAANVNDGMADVIRKLKKVAGSDVERNVVPLDADVLDSLYRRNWIVSRVVDCPADDMARDGIELTVPDDPDAAGAFADAEKKVGLWDAFTAGKRWARLFGGSLGVLLIDGQNLSDPLDVGKVPVGSFRGIMIFNRHEIDTSKDVITELGRDTGLPESYEIKSTKQKVHHSRTLRFIGAPLSRKESEKEKGWGGSVVEKIITEARNAKIGSQAVANLLRFAYLRIFNIEGLRDLVAAGGKSQEQIERHFQYIAELQELLGVTVLDGADKFGTADYSFGGITDAYSVLKEQVSGGSGIPQVRLFGDTPRGLNTDGDSQVTTYHDELMKDMESDFRPKLDIVIPIMLQSELGRVPENWSFVFRPLRELRDEEKSVVIDREAGAVAKLYEIGLLDKPMALRELREIGRKYGRFAGITDEEIKKAENEAPSADDLARQADELARERAETGNGETAGKAGLLRQRQPA